MGYRVMHNFKRFLLEGSYTPSDIPRYFRLMLDVRFRSEETLPQLAKMELDGVKGISDKGKIIYQFLGDLRDTMLLMDAQDVIDANKLSKFMYDNVHYFLSKNMMNLKRMWMKNKNDNRGVWHNIGDYLFKRLAQDGVISKYFAADGSGQKISWTEACKNTRVNSIKDAVKVLRMAMRERLDGKDSYYDREFENVLELSNKKLGEVIHDSLKTAIGSYADEGEWVVKNNKLKIPKKSRLFIVLNYDNKQVQKVLDDIEKDAFLSPNRDGVLKQIKFKKDIKRLGIDKKYIIKYVNAREWAKVKQRYLDKKYS